MVTAATPSASASPIAAATMRSRVSEPRGARGGRRLAWRIRDNRSVWAFELEEVDSGTELLHRRETPDGIHPQALAREERFMGGVARFEASLLEGMRRTLEGVRRDAERPHPG